MITIKNKKKKIIFLVIGIIIGILFQVIPINIERFQATSFDAREYRIKCNDYEIVFERCDRDGKVKAEGPSGCFQGDTKDKGFPFKINNHTYCRSEDKTIYILMLFNVLILTVFVFIIVTLLILLQKAKSKNIKKAIYITLSLIVLALAFYAQHTAMKLPRIDFPEKQPLERVEYKESLNSLHEKESSPLPLMIPYDSFCLTDVGDPYKGFPYRTTYETSTDCNASLVTDKKIEGLNILLITVSGWLGIALLAKKGAAKPSKIK